MVQARHITWKYKLNENETISLQTEFKYIQLIYKTLQYMVWSSKLKDPTSILTITSSDSARPVGLVHPTGRTGRLHAADSTGQTGPTDRSDQYAQNRESAHSAHKCTTWRTPSLGVSLHDLPPLCIPADELDTAGAEVHVRVSCNNIVATNPEYSNTQ